MPKAESYSWVDAAPEHVTALQHFICADPPKAAYGGSREKYHPRPWELEVQSGLRDLRLPLPDSERLVIALDSAHEVAGAVRLSFDVTGEQMMILAIATRHDLQRQGIATRALEIAVDIIERTRVAYELNCDIWAKIHRENLRSQKVFAAAGFEWIESVDESGLDYWAKLFVAPDPLGRKVAGV
ncbi:GNAT family N-acetyltransferase [Subtercola endophyticus]|uniref:GNAT family N-acetyltransferase n=1 Tax=Subtercola endophyticus TaxID=2895559 RepID=UPI001E50499D|nr:GNAT family N-acetyltransferase [Subtercola endophyticus]UFS59417.1 GNAT family N-acetyltransferase [Subtercola endophyticus]